MAVTRVGPDCSALDSEKLEDVLDLKERITLEQAIESYTINGAYSMFIDDITGSLEVGKKADIVVLNDNLFNYKDHPKDIFENVHVTKTIFGGEIVYETKV